VLATPAWAAGHGRKGEADEAHLCAQTALRRAAAALRCRAAALRTPRRRTAPRPSCGAHDRARRATQAEIKKKIADATTNKGGGAAGLADRKGGVVGHAKFKCPICSQQAPDLKVPGARRGLSRLAGDGSAV